MKSKISIICAVDKNRGIGKDNKLLFHISDDLKRFKQLTLDHPVIMGRKTFESIGRPLPNRTNIVITRDRTFTAENTIIVHSLDEALIKASDATLISLKAEKEIFIIGGGQIFGQALPIADKLYLTLVEGEFEADTFFPDYSAFKKVVFKQEGKSDGYKYTFLELEKR